LPEIDPWLARRACDAGGYADGGEPTGHGRDVASPLYHCVAYLAARTSKIAPCTRRDEAFRSPGAVDVVGTAITRLPVTAS